MPINLRGRSVLTLDAFSPQEIRYLLRLASDLKAAKDGGYEEPRLARKNIALIFEKDSTRTRTGFEVAAYDQGAHVTYLGPSGSQIGHKESMKDTARVLGRIYDAIEYRGFAQSIVEELSLYAGVPIYNGLTDESHPTQTLADFMTMREFTHKHLSDLAVAFLGDGRNNVARSLAIGAVKVGIDMRIAAPKALWPDDGFVAHANSVGAATGGTLSVTETVADAVAAADFLYTTFGCRWVKKNPSGDAASSCSRHIASPPRLWRRAAILSSNSCTACRPFTTRKPKSAPISPSASASTAWR